MATSPPPLIPEASHFKTLVTAIEVECLRKSGKSKEPFTVFGQSRRDLLLLRGVHIVNAKEIANVQNSDIHAPNGIIHVIDRVILP